MNGYNGNISSEELQQKISEFESKCRDSGLKVTPQRIAVYQALVESSDHPSAEVICRRVRKVLPGISLDTVNRTLHTLSEMGAAFVIEGSGDAMRFDGNLRSHQHFKCIKCKRIVDFHDEGFDNIEVPSSISERFKVLRACIYIEGICDACCRSI
ncbi:MAG: Fur family transcriptional regulator [Planctomycetota bacterium]